MDGFVEGIELTTFDPFWDHIVGSEVHSGLALYKHMLGT